MGAIDFKETYDAYQQVNEAERLGLPAPNQAKAILEKCENRLSAKKRLEPV